MTTQETVARYYDAWQTKHGDLADVPLADDFQFTGPVASFDNADGYRAMAREAGQAVTSFEVRTQFVEGDTVCSVIDWEMAIPGVGPKSRSCWSERARATRPPSASSSIRTVASSTCTATGSSGRSRTPKTSFRRLCWQRGAGLIGFRVAPRCARGCIGLRRTAASTRSATAAAGRARYRR